MSESRQAFLEALRRELASLPAAEVEKSVAFIEEMIDDRMEDGASEAEAVAALGDPVEAARAIVAELPPIPKAIAKSKTNSSTANWILAVVLSPVWIPLALLAASTVLAIYLVIWGLALAVWILAIGFLCTGPMGIAVAAYCLFVGLPETALWQLGAGVFCFGLGVYCLFGAKKASVWFIEVSRRYAAKVKSLFVKAPQPEQPIVEEAAYEG